MQLNSLTFLSVFENVFIFLIPLISFDNDNRLLGPYTRKLYNEVGARLYFYSCLWFCSRGRRDSIPACIAGGIPACLADLQAHTQGGSWGVWPGGVSRPTLGGVSKPTSRGYPSMHWGRPPSPRLLLRAVRILLECILVGIFRSKNIFHLQIIWSKGVKREELKSMKETIVQGKKAKLIKEGGEFDEDKFRNEVFMYTVVKENFSVTRCRYIYAVKYLT